MKNLKTRQYQICTRCVMDTTDSKITFDENGVCDHCRNFDKNIKPFWNAKEDRLKLGKQEKAAIMTVFLVSVVVRTVHIWPISPKK